MVANVGLWRRSELVNIVLRHEVDEAWIVSQLAKDNRSYSMLQL